MGSYGVGIGRAWCSRKACEICSSLVQKKKLKKNDFSSHKLPKQQSTSFWSQGILGVNQYDADGERVHSILATGKWWHFIQVSCSSSLPVFYF
jgi:hypothetical protein